MRQPRVPSLALLVCLQACATSDTAPIADGPPPTYYHDAKPLLQRYCTECHQRGGIGPFVLTDLSSAQHAAPLLHPALTSGAMPPWMPSDFGQPLRYDRRMRPQDRDILLRWVAAGALAGDPQDSPRTDIPPPELAPSPRPDLILDTGASYTPKMGQSDDYRCFVVDPFAAKPTVAPDGNMYLESGEVRPQVRTIVHHVLIYAIPPELVSVAKAQDAADPGPGYTCFGDPLAGRSNQPGVQTVLGWEAPGGPWLLLPSKTGVRIPRGAQLVIQIHYALINYQSVQGGQGASDRTQVVLQLTSKVPDRLAYTVGLSDPPGLHIAAGNPDAVQRFTVPMSAVVRAAGISCPGGKPCPLEIFGNFPHLHLLGKSVTTRVVGGPILVDIPHWNFHWQGDYQFQNSLLVPPDAAISVECHYDNSAHNQPVIDGQVQVPHDVAWGPGALDEMCLSYLFVLPASSHP